MTLSFNSQSSLEIQVLPIHCIDHFNTHKSSSLSVALMPHIQILSIMRHSLHHLFYEIDP